MRALPLVLVVLLALPVVDAGWSRLAYREIEGPGWAAESFTLTTTNRIWLAFDSLSDGEITGHMIALYDDAGKLLRGTTFFSTGGQLVEATLAQGEVRVTNDGVDETALGAGVFPAEVRWTCDATCNPSRTFTIVVTSGGELDGWRYALWTEGATKIANATGPEAYAMTSRAFDGTVVHAGTPLRGVHVAQAATTQAHADHTMLATFVSAGTPETMRVEGARDQACPCLAGDWTPGDYTFRYQDVDVNGFEGFLTWADVELP